MATAYPGGLRKRGGLLDEFMAPDYSYLARRAELTPKQREYAANAPIDFLRGTFAGLLGTPADVANIPQSPMPMEQFGEYSYAPAQKIPYGSEYFLKNLPLAPAEDNPLGRVAGQVGSFAPMVPVQAARMAGKGVMATGRFVAPKAGQLAEQYMVNTGGILPLDVYHGSPHIFPPTPRNPLGEFDASKIGTGEGAQAFGHGIYTAENPNIAEGYAEQLSAAQGPLGDVAKYWRKNGGESAFRAFAKDAGLPPAEIESTANVIRNTGNLYKVDLPDKKIARMLDWDKPLSDQPEFVKNTLINDMGVDNNWASISGDSSGGALYDAMLKEYGSPEALSAALMNQGIPGIKYLDATSRSAGKGTRNFVVFPGEEKSMTILERNAQKADELKRLQAGGLLAP